MFSTVMHYNAASLKEILYCYYYAIIPLNDASVLSDGCQFQQRRTTIIEKFWNNRKKVERTYFQKGVIIKKKKILSCIHLIFSSSFIL